MEEKEKRKALNQLSIRELYILNRIIRVKEKEIEDRIKANIGNSQCLEEELEQWEYIKIDGN